MKREVVSISITDKCNLNCPFCYTKKEFNNVQTKFLDQVDQFSEVTKRVAIGGGEPLLFPEFVLEFSKKCPVDVVLTTNGKLLLKNIDSLCHLDGISISYDYYKWKRFSEYISLLKESKKKLDCYVSCNYLLFDHPISELGKISTIANCADFVFLLFPKKVRTIYTVYDYLEMFYVLLDNYDNIRFDEYIAKTITEGQHWKSPCHYGRMLVSVNSDFKVAGCSFDSHRRKILNISEIKKLKFKERFSCVGVKV